MSTAQPAHPPITAMTGKHMCGVTLIELLVVVAVVGILAAIAYPSYTEYVNQGRRADAKSVMSELSSWLERNYSTNGCYNKSTPGNCTAQSGTTVSLPITQSPKSGTAFYAISVTFAGSGQSYTLSAAPTGGYSDATCGTLSITQAGVKTESGTGTVADCWDR